MPVLQNQRHECFAQEIAKGKTADEAYVVAGFKPNRGNASTLKAKQSILDRVAEIRAASSKRAEITLARLLEMAEAVYTKAIGAGQNAAAIAAVKELGVLSGERVEKRENLNRSANDVSDDELAAIARSGGDGIATAPKRPQVTH